jgi:hypothetical protein
MVGGYHIDKNGTVTGTDNYNLVADLQGLHSFKAIIAVYDKLLPEAKEVPENWESGITEFDELGCPHLNDRYRDYAEPPAYDTPESCAAYVPDCFVIEVPKEGISDEALSNLQKLVSSKSSLIKKALGADRLDIEVTDDRISFPWFNRVPEPEEVNAYTHFISQLVSMAKTLHRVNATFKEVDAEKYSFRCFLLRLGFIGNEYKATRKTLLKKLSGSSAFSHNKDGVAENE